MNRNDDAILAWDNQCQDECEIVANFINAHQSIGATPRMRSGVKSRDRLALDHLDRVGRDRIAGP